MYNDIEENIRKNLMIFLSHHGCKVCFKPYSDFTFVEIDNLTFIFSEKLFYKLDCSVADNLSSFKKNYRFYTNAASRATFSLLKPLLHGNIIRFGITCINCMESKYLEWNLSKFDGSNIYLK